MTLEVLVTIPQGTLRGTKEESLLGGSYCSFQRIPYAKPPVGRLRFKAPEPADGWTGVRDATQQGAIFPASILMSNQYAEDSDEDSLFINVYAKQQPGGHKHPVMVWFHGGGFTNGTGNKNMYGPDYFMAHDLVLVSFNYRLGALGFLSLQTQECPGNFGLKDQRLALKWIQENISYFGGDPQNVTIFGESAGGASVQYHVLSTSTRGLFTRALAMSGSALNRWAYSKNPRACAFKLGKRMGCDTIDDSVLLDFLIKASTKDIVEHSDGLLIEVEEEAVGEERLSFPFTPTAEPESEEAFITQHPWEILKSGEYQDVPYMTGVCTKEMLIGVMGLDQFPNWDRDEQFQALIPKELNLTQNSACSLEVARKIREFYFKDGINIDNFIDALSATFFVYGVYRTVKSHISNEKIMSPNYLYVFTYDGGRGVLKKFLGYEDYTGTTHADEIGYLFPTELAPLPPLELGSLDHGTTLKLINIYVNFASTGKPNGSETSWPPTDPESWTYMDIGNDLQLKTGFFKEEMQFWDEIYSLVCS